MLNRIERSVDGKFISWIPPSGLCLCVTSEFSILDLSRAYGERFSRTTGEVEKTGGKNKVGVIGAQDFFRGRVKISLFYANKAYSGFGRAPERYSREGIRGFSS